MSFSFERVVGSSCDQHEAFEQVSDFLEYRRSKSQTLLAYGHTGSGKTHTVFGSKWLNAFESLVHSDDTSLCQQILEDRNSFGLIQRVLAGLFSKPLEEVSSIACSFFQIYNEKIIDLLNPKQEDLQVKLSPVHGVLIDGLTVFEVYSCENSLEVLKKGYLMRKVRDNSLNKFSSRSHTVFQLLLSVRAETGLRVARAYQTVKLNFCDLAGSEKFIDEVEYSKEHFKELKNINLSLSTLSKVILQLSSKSYSHFHFRESKLTRVLQDSLDGKIPTILLATLSPTS